MKNDLSNQRFGRLMAFEDVGRAKDGQVLWRCLCDCGKTVVTRAGQLRQGKTKSCGCWLKDYPSRLRHGWARSDKRSGEWLSWRNLKQRCLKPDNTQYKDYGARGIKVCNRWLNSFENFIADMGPKPSARHTIERKNNNGDYKPSNCKWETKSRQARNKRNSLMVMFHGQRTSACDLAERFQIQIKTLKKRLKLGWSVTDALTRPVQSRLRAA